MASVCHLHNSGALFFIVMLCAAVGLLVTGAVKEWSRGIVVMTTACYQPVCCCVISLKQLTNN